MRSRFSPHHGVCQAGALFLSFPLRLMNLNLCSKRPPSCRRALDRFLVCYFFFMNERVGAGGAEHHDLAQVLLGPEPRTPGPQAREPKALSPAPLRVRALPAGPPRHCFHVRLSLEKGLPAFSLVIGVRGDTDGHLRCGEQTRAEGAISPTGVQRSSPGCVSVRACRTAALPRARPRFEPGPRSIGGGSGFPRSAPGTDGRTDGRIV